MHADYIFPVHRLDSRTGFRSQRILSVANPTWHNITRYGRRAPMQEGARVLRGKHGGREPPSLRKLYRRVRRAIQRVVVGERGSRPSKLPWRCKVADEIINYCQGSFFVVVVVVVHIFGTDRRLFLFRIHSHASVTVYYSFIFRLLTRPIHYCFRY